MGLTAKRVHLKSTTKLRHKKTQIMTTKDSWVPWVRVAKHLIKPWTPVLHKPEMYLIIVKQVLVMLVVIMILKNTATLQVLFIVSLFCAWNITTVEINSGVNFLKG